MFTPNRIAVYLTVLAGIAGAVAPVVADMDWTSVAGIIAGLAAILGVVDRWLKGWQKYEAQTAQNLAGPAHPPLPEDRT